MADGFAISKEEAVVMLDLVFMHGQVPVSISAAENVSDTRKQEIISSLLSSGVLKQSNGRYIPNKGLDPYLLPMCSCNCVVMYKRTNTDSTNFSVTVYPSPKGMSAILDDASETICFRSLNSEREALTLLSPFSADVDAISYIILNADNTVIHFGKHINAEQIEIIEIKKLDNGKNVKQNLVVSISDYKKMLTERLNEVLSCC